MKRMHGCTSCSCKNCVCNKCKSILESSDGNKVRQKSVTRVATPKDKSGWEQLAKDLGATLIDKQFTDVEIVVGDEIIHAHKYVLSARSAVFKALFQNEMLERKSHIIAITDTKEYIFKLFLAYLYSGTLKDKMEDEAVFGLYSLADKYDVPKLQETCRRILCNSLNENNACGILRLAELHSDEKLKQSAIIYICQFFHSLKLTADWTNLVDVQPRLASEVLHNLSEKLSSLKSECGFYNKKQRKY